MNIESQVCSLELAKRLKELGVKQKSFFKYEVKKDGYLTIYHSKATSCANEYYSAFTVAELGEMLPHSLQADTASKNNSILEINKNLNNRWILVYAVHSNLPPTICIIDDNEANARAKMLISLIENSLIDLKEINNG